MRDRNNQLVQVIDLFQSRQHGAADPSIDGEVPLPNGDFIWGPISLDWLVRAANLSGKTFVVAIALQFLRGRSGFARVALHPKLIRRFGLSRQTAYRALRDLESAGLVSVNRQRGRAPRVMFLEFVNGNLSSDRKPA